MAEFELMLAHERADVLPESPLAVHEFKPEIDATPWLVVEVEHRLGNAGLGTRVRSGMGGEKGR